MAMSSNTTTVKRRKTLIKSKSKYADTSRSAVTTTATTTNLTDPVVNSRTTDLFDKATEANASSNKRLQRFSLSDILVGIMPRTTKKEASSNSVSSNTSNNNPTTALVLRATSPTLYNGSIACCRDVNCRLNALTALIQQKHHHQCTQRASVCSNSSSSSYMSHTKSSRRSRSSTVTGLNPTERTVTPAEPANSAAALRDGSPDSGVGSDAAMAKVFHATTETTSDDSTLSSLGRYLTVHLQLDLCTWFLFVLAVCTRFYKLSIPRHVVFDEIHYGKYISLYLRNIFFFDQHPPLGKQLIAAVAYTAGGYDGNYTFPHIGAEYNKNVPIFWLRFLPALCGSALAPIVYKLLMSARLSRWSALLGGVLIILDNALLTQSRFILMESMLLFFEACGLYYMLRFQDCRFGSSLWLLFGLASASCFSFATSVKYAGVLTYILTAYLSCRYLWDKLYDATLSNLHIILETIGRIVLFTIVPILLYVSIFYIHLQTLYRAGPHDSIMTSAFQASLDGGLASITKGQPLKVVHGSQITLRHTHGRTCWLHSHAHVYPVRYPDKRGSSHQQQVTCYSFKDVNNWWIIKRPNREDLVVGNELDVIRHGDIIQLVHGITSRGLNSHDVAAPMTPQCQEVSCYIDYEIKMPGELLWRVEILNRDTEGPVWHAIKSEVRLIHHTTGAALRYSGRQLPEWGFNQHEVVADRTVEHKDAIWNVEEHRYTKTQDQRERERQLLKAEMIPTKKTKLSFLAKFFELQTKMLWNTKQLDAHMYSSSPLEWPLLDKGIAYWVDTKTSSQIHLLGNIIIWYTGTAALIFYIILNVFYVLRRRRLCFDLPEREWHRFRQIGDIFLVAYFIHYLPYFTLDRALFLHNYLPAFLFKLLLLCYVLEHIDYLLRLHCYGNCKFAVNGTLQPQRIWLVRSYRLGILLWLTSVIWVFIKFLPLTYGIHKLSVHEVISLRWKDTWDFIIQVNKSINNPINK
ncbi:protein O-mannosyltransferase 1 [Zeugodacus cucurbitae]|uniref:Protein O-mannosyltransferase 1 n=1 Tax=Zeugodacus cucurbitae TaxID=28588 RepID=A0A0A1WD25_ZEUCU|nr:protein O-mannosyltransferase 1 [Zeugodacus cucurbitae]